MKRSKIIIAVLSTIMALSVTACTAKDANTVENQVESTKDISAATIVTNEGETVEMTATELIDVYDSNEAKFEKTYTGAEITFTGTVKSVNTKCSVCATAGKVSANQNKIVFEEGWCLIIGSENYNAIDLADIEKGETITVTTGIVGAPFDTDFLKEVSNNERVMWLVGNDKINDDGPYNDIETVTSKPAQLAAPAE